MRPNTTKNRFLANEPIVNAWLSISSSYAAEIVAQQGFHSVTVDLQHGMIGFESAMTLFQAISTTSATPLVRCPSLDESVIMRLLDAGAYGVICPQIDNADMARRFVAACRYAPEGSRSFGPARGLLYGGPDYFEHANDHVLALAMIESRDGLDNVEAILATPGLDGIYIGPNDLALSLGVKPGAETTGIVAQAVAHILAATRAHGLLAGIFCASSALARQRLAEGFHLVTPGNDANILGMACKVRVEETLT